MWSFQVNTTTLVSLQARVDVLGAAVRELVKLLPAQQRRCLEQSMADTCANLEAAGALENYDAAAAGELARVLGACSDT